jgi:peptidoglycan/xylan/chitin deacetylase (PgdA/CDA1 family)
MPDEMRRSSRRARRNSPSALPVLAVIALVAVLGVAGATWWFSVGGHRAASTQAPSAPGSAQAQTPVALTAPKNPASAGGSPTPPASTDATSTPTTDSAAEQAAQASVSASEQAAVRFPGAPAVSPTLKSINHLHPRHKYIALTLDDGYNFQPTLLDLLKQYDVHCTTFLVGSWAAANKADVQAMKDAGFEIANHSWSHPFLTRLSSTQVAAELTKTQRVLTSITGNQAPYLRPPFGDTNPSVKATAASLGYRIVMWDRTFGDSGRGATPAKLYSNVVYSGGGVQPGDVILCHWGSKPSYEALKKILPDLRAQGFEFVTISELIADSK